jgi:hypothetical protein
MTATDTPTPEQVGAEHRSGHPGGIDFGVPVRVTTTE